MNVRYKPGIGGDSGYTLIELIIIVLVVGVLATVAVPVIGNMIGVSKESATRKEMTLIKTAIVGRTDGEIRGYENDVGSPPPSLQGLVSRPAGVAVYNRFTKIGWNGPYLEADNDAYLMDAWGVNYVYDSVARTIKSAGGPDTITVAY